MFVSFLKLHIECQKGIKLTTCTSEFSLIYFSNFPITNRDKENKKEEDVLSKWKYSCKAGICPFLLEKALFSLGGSQS